MAIFRGENDEKTDKKDGFKSDFWSFGGSFSDRNWPFGALWIGKYSCKSMQFRADERTYYMPGELISEGDWSAFRGSNGMVYEYDHDVFGDDLEDAPYLLTMDSRGTKEWYDDEILVIWKAIA